MYIEVKNTKWLHLVLFSIAVVHKKFFASYFYYANHSSLSTGKKSGTIKLQQAVGKK